MLSIPVLVTLLVGLGSWSMTGIVMDWLKSDKKIQDNERRILPTNANMPETNYALVTSPYSFEHFIEYNNNMFAKYRTVYEHMRFIEYDLESIQMNDWLTHWVIRVNYRTRMEYHYDVRFEDGLIDMIWETRIAISDFHEESLDDDQFKLLLEFYCMVQIWNHHYKQYPTLMQHKAYVGKNRKEHEHLR